MLLHFVDTIATHLTRVGLSCLRVLWLACGVCGVLQTSSPLCVAEWFKLLVAQQQAGFKLL